MPNPCGVRGSVHPDLAGAGGDFRRKQVHDQTVLVGRPHTSVLPQETRAGAFLAAKTARTVEEAVDKPLETHRNFTQRAPERLHDPVDQATADQSLAYHGFVGPLGPVSQKVMDGDGEVVVRVHQSHRTGNDAMPVCVGVVCESNFELVL